MQDAVHTQVICKYVCVCQTIIVGKGKLETDTSYGITGVSALKVRHLLRMQWLHMVHCITLLFDNCQERTD